MSDIIHQPEQQRFICILNDRRALLAYRPLGAGTVEAYHTEVPPELKGQGIADRLARGFYDWCMAEELTIVPSCAYVASWLRRHADEDSARP